MSRFQSPCQRWYLAHWIKRRQLVSVYLRSGPAVIATIVDQNPWQLFLRDSQNREIILFKGSITWITEHRPEASCQIVASKTGGEPVMRERNGPGEITLAKSSKSQKKVTVTVRKVRRVDPREID